MSKFTVGWGGAGDYWNEILKEFKGREVSAIEVGTFQGKSAKWFMDNILTHPSATLTCIDTFEGLYRYSDAKNGYSDDHEIPLLELCKNNLKDYPNVTILEGKSQDVLCKLDGKYDFIYIDGDHRAASVLKDAVLAFRLLKFGGILIFDDYLWQDPRYPNPEDAPKLGIDCFLKAFKGHYIDILKDYQYSIRKVSFL